MVQHCILIQLQLYFGTVYFIDNSGYQGGAILLFGKSDIYVDDGISNSTFALNITLAVQWRYPGCQFAGYAANFLGSHVF